MFAKSLECRESLFSTSLCLKAKCFKYLKSMSANNTKTEL